MKLRPIRPEDDLAVAAIIRTVMPEFGAKGPGFAIDDPEVDGMYDAYAGPRARYFVVEDEALTGGRVVVGGGGVAPLLYADGAADEGVCELRKMYFLPSARGRGVGKALLARCLEEAKTLGYRTMYLETLRGMDAAQHLYRTFGFAPLSGPMGKTGHFSCDTYFAKAL